jgi:hypothetical protein
MYFKLLEFEEVWYQYIHLENYKLFKKNARFYKGIKFLKNL